MQRIIWNGLLLMSLLVCAASAEAQIGEGHNCLSMSALPDGARVVPDTPRAGDAFAVEIFGFRGISPVDIDAMNVQRLGNVIRVEAQINDGIGFSVGTGFCRREAFPGLPEGDYELHYYRASPLPSGDYGPYTLQTVVPFGVGPPAATRIIPATGVWSLALLAGCLALFAFFGRPRGS